MVSQINLDAFDARMNQLDIAARKSILATAEPKDREILEQRFRTGDCAVPEESRDNSGGTSESKGHVMPWNKK